MSANTSLCNTLAAALAVALCRTAAANAPATPDADDAPRKEAAHELESVVVTATKIEQPLSETPMAVSAIGAKQLERQRIERFDDYLGQVPAMTSIATRPGSTQLILRGISAGTQSNSMVSVYVDESPYGVTSSFARAGYLTPDFDPYDMQRIEVLRGPQGTLYGANSLGGVLKFITARPDPGGFEGQAQVQATSATDGGSGFGARALVNVPLSETVAVRANAFRRRDPGFIRDAATGRDDVNATDVDGGRVALGWTPNDALALTFTAMAQNLSSDGSPSVDLRPDLAPRYGERTQYRFLDETFDVAFRQYNVTAEVDFGATRLVSSTSYGTQRNTFLSDATLLWRNLLGGALGPPFDGYGYAEAYRIGQKKFTQEVRLASSGERTLAWQTGVYYTDENTTNHQRILPHEVATRRPDFTPLDALGDELFVASLPASYDEIAAFGNVTWTFSPTFDVTFGARYGKNEQVYKQKASGALLVTDVRKTSSDATWTYLVNPRWRPSDDVMVYARIANGYRPGGPNVVPPNAASIPASFEPDSLVSYEVGVKADWFDRRLSLDTAAFYIDWTDVQLGMSRNGFTFRGNGGKARSWGSETALRWLPADGLTLAVSAAYTDARLAADVVDGEGKRGNRLPYVPRLSGSVNADYERPLNDAWRWFVGTTYRYSGDRTAEFGVAADGLLKIPSYGQWDLRAGLEHEHWTLSAYVKNVRDDGNVVSIGTLGATPADGYSASVLQPRTVGVSVAWSF
jgi:outer membrane receptor protein involved in Fe transport